MSPAAKREEERMISQGMVFEEVWLLPTEICIIKPLRDLFIYLKHIGGGVNSEDGCINSA